jgi:hypothetical protein
MMCTLDNTNFHPPPSSYNTMIPALPLAVVQSILILLLLHCCSSMILLAGGEGHPPVLFVPPLPTASLSFSSPLSFVRRRQAIISNPGRCCSCLRTTPAFCAGNDDNNDDGSGINRSAMTAATAIGHRAALFCLIYVLAEGGGSLGCPQLLGRNHPPPAHCHRRHHPRRRGLLPWGQGRCCRCCCHHPCKCPGWQQGCGNAAVQSIGVNVGKDA